MLQSTHKVKLNLTYGQLQPILDWCERNCTGEWQYMEDPDGDMYFSWVFLFNDDRDYVAFKIWKT